MPTADGSIIIDSKIRTDGFEAGSKELEAACKRTANKVKGIGEAAQIALQKQVNAFAKANQAVAKQGEKVDELKQKIKEAKETPIKTDEFADLEKEIAKTKEAFAKLDAKKKRFLETGGDENSKTFQRMEYDGEQLDAQFDELIAKKQELESSGGAYQTLDTGGLENQLLSEQEKLDGMASRLNTSYAQLSQTFAKYGQDTVDAISGTQRFEMAMEELVAHFSSIGNTIVHPIKAGEAKLQEAIAAVEDRMAGAMANVVNAISHPIQALKNLGSSVKNAFGSAAGKIKSAIDKIKQFGSKIKEAASNLLHLKSSSKGMGENLSGSFSKGLKSLLKYGLGIRSLFVLFNRLRSAVKEGLNNMVQFSGGTNAAMSSMMSALTQLKNSLGAAFAPIIETVAPLITSFVNMLSGAINAVNAFISSLLGRSTYTKAIAVQQDYAASLDNTASSAKNAGKATKNAEKEAERWLAGFDEIQKASSESGSGSGGGSGSGSGGGAGGLTPSMMFETVPIEGAVTNWAEMFKEAWEKTDFTEIGGIIGGKLRDALDKIPWNQIQQTAKKVGSSLATFLNGAIETPSLWESVGRTAAGGMNTVIQAITGFVDNFHFDSLGTGIGTGINEAVSNIQWDTAATTLGTGINGVFSGLTSFINTTDWTNLGSKITSSIQTAFNTVDFSKITAYWSAKVKGKIDWITGLIQGVNWASLPGDLVNAAKEALTGFDYSGLSESIGKLLGAALKAVVDFSAGVKALWDNLVASIKDYFTKHIKDAKASGGSVADGILNGIADAFKAIGTWVKENILTPFINGFKSAFGIHSPAKNPDLLEAAGYVGEGILNGIKSVFTNMGDWVKNNILTPVSNAVKKAPEAVVEFAAKVKDGATQWVSDVKSYWSKKTQQGKAVLGSFAANVSNGAKTWWSNVKTYWSSKTNKGTSVAGTFAAGVANSAKTWWSNVKTYWKKQTNDGTATAGSFTATVDGFSDAIAKKDKVIKGFKVQATGVNLDARLASGGVIQNGVITRFASGGSIVNGIAKMWNSIPGYAGGTTNAHGTLFRAGEAGPEIVGHIGGRTEVLNKSQIAQAIYSAVVAAFGKLQGYFSSMTYSLARIPDAIQQITASLPEITVDIPLMATGTVIPPQAVIASEDANALRRAMEELTDALKAGRTQTPTFAQQYAQNNANRQPVVVPVILNGREMGRAFIDFMDGEADQGHYPALNWI